ncbi:MAG: proteasome assembly chaperone family protein [Candidatus Thermoplasmatota archaeon]|jgi:hypothetical protein
MAAKRASNPSARSPDRSTAGQVIRFTEHAKPKVANPIFVEGLPGIGHVGKLAAQHIVESGKATLWATLHSPDFPPQVTVGEDGVARLLTVKLWTLPAKGKSPALVVMTGDAQPQSGPGQWALVESTLDRLAPLGCRELYTLGGYGTGARVEKPEVLCAVTDKAKATALRKAGLKLSGDESPGGGIIGASGLFLGLAAQRGWTGACLMGETNGYLVDPKAARAVLASLGKVLGRAFDLSHLEDTAGELDRITAQLHAAMGAAQGSRESTDHYIG